MPKFPRPNIFLVDGFALIYRSFFAMIQRPLTTSRGENTSAAWGVANFLLRVRDEYRPDYVVWINDAGSSFRTEMFPDYKATRQKLDDELQQAFDRSVERIQQMLEAFGVPLVVVEGYEADDVIGTLTDMAGAAGVHSVIVSGDKDFYQLIAPAVSLLNPGRGGPAGVSEELVSVDNASERLGVPPDRVIDYLALVGDSSDNVPGVKGVGDKTARKLIEEYGGLDDILANADAVKGKRAREALLADADNARLSRYLVTIQRDVDVKVSFDELTLRDPDPAALAALFHELEFSTLLDRVSGEAARDAGSDTVESDYRTVKAVEEAQAVVEEVRATGCVALAIQTTLTEPRQGALMGLALCPAPGKAWYLPFAHGAMTLDLIEEPESHNLPSLASEAMLPLATMLRSDGIEKTGHDLKSVAHFLDAEGVTLGGVGYDSQLAAFLVEPGRRSHDLASLANEFLGMAIPTREHLTGRGKSARSLADVPVDQVGGRCCLMADAGFRLRQHQRAQIEGTAFERLLREIELPLLGVLGRMERRGIRIDTEMLGDLAGQFRLEAGELERRIQDAAGTDFNVNSTPQLRHVLFEKLGLPIIKKTKTGPSTDAEVLAQLATMGFDVPIQLLEYRELNKLISTYVDALPRSVDRRSGRIHTTFNQIGAATGRLSSSDPNLQNIPIRTERGGLIRKCFVPADGLVFVVADYSQIELRLLAHLSEDEAFIAAFARGGDIHRETAAIIFEVDVEDVTAEMRARAKTINFATIYGQGPFALSRQLEITQDEAKEFIARYFERFNGVRRFLDATIEQARERGFVETLFGRRRYIPELRDRNFNVRSFGERTAMNSPIQGSAADLIKIAMVNLDTVLESANLGAAMLLQVHDELVLEAAPADTDAVVRIVRSEMIGAAHLKVPLVVDIGVGPNWLDAKA